MTSAKMDTLGRIRLEAAILSALSGDGEVKLSTGDLLRAVNEGRTARWTYEQVRTSLHRMDAAALLASERPHGLRDKYWWRR